MGTGSKMGFRRVAALMAAALAFAGMAGCSPGGSSDREPAAAGSLSAAADTASTPPAAAIARAFDSVYRRHRAAMLGICMGAIDGQTRLVKCYGKVRRGSSTRPTAKTLFQIGSISKTMTATLLALRVKDGSVGLADPIRRYIPASDGSADVPESITLLDLAEHYSGLPRSTPTENSDHVASADEYLAAFGRCETRPDCPVGSPGARYAYSNFAYGVLGEALAHHDGHADSSYSAWERDNDANVTGPLGMTQTHSGLAWRASSPKAFEALRARATVGDPPHEAVPPFFPPPPHADAAGGLYSSSVDMVTWLSYSMGLSGTPALNAARPLLYDTPRIVRRRDDPSDARRRIGLAWRIDLYGSGPSSTTCISKSGESRGFSSHMAFVKGRRLGAFVVLNNVPEDPTATAIGTDVINSLPPAPGTAPRAGVCGGAQ